MLDEAGDKDAEAVADAVCGLTWIASTLIEVMERQGDSAERVYSVFLEPEFSDA